MRVLSRWVLGEEKKSKKEKEGSSHGHPFYTVFSSSSSSKKKEETGNAEGHMSPQDCTWIRHDPLDPLDPLSGVFLIMLTRLDGMPCSSVHMCTSTHTQTLFVWFAACLFIILANRRGMSNRASHSMAMHLQGAVSFSDSDSYLCTLHMA